jgi:hypothetical protein
MSFVELKRTAKPTVIVLFVITILLSFYRLSIVVDNEISWDILGYYLYLPATFVHADPLLENIEWLKELNEQHNLAGTLYMLAYNAQGEPMYFFLMGMSILYLPFFFLATAYAHLFGFPVDGFSMPYQYFLVIGGIIYTLIGLFYLRKILLQFLPEKISALTLLILVFGTNYVHHFSVDNLATVNAIFMLNVFIIWNTIQWHKYFKISSMLAIGLSTALLILVKPSEIFILFIPLLWKVVSWDSLKQKVILFYKHKGQLLLSIFMSLLVLLPQMLYWYAKTGSFIFDSYQNPGVGLDFLSPHLFDTLFSYRKGWLLYTPIMLFAMAGFYFMFRQKRSVFYAAFIYFMVTFYVISSWTEWWYGAGFSLRPIIDTYPILAISLGFFLQFVLQERRWIKYSFILVISFLMLFNQFQWFQFKAYIIHPFRTTKAYYWANFFNTEVDDSTFDKLLVYRDFSGQMELKDPQHYASKIQSITSFDVLGDSTNGFYHVNPSQEYLQILLASFESLSQRDHFWVRVRLKIRFLQARETDFLRMVGALNRSNGTYGYYSNDIAPRNEIGQWQELEFTYLTPEIRDKRDIITCYLWNRGQFEFDVDDIQVEILERK